MRFVALLFAWATVVSAQQVPVTNLANIGPKVGESVPDFELPDQRGTPRKLSALLGPKGAMLVFYRSADW
jgi:hypothetical protein